MIPDNTVNVIHVLDPTLFEAISGEMAVSMSATKNVFGIVTNEFHGGCKYANQNHSCQS